MCDDISIKCWKIFKFSTDDFKFGLEFWQLTFVLCSRIQREINQWNKRQFGDRRKWNCIYEVRDLFPWEMLTKMVISCFLNVKKIWDSAQINLSSTLNCFRRYFFDATIYADKSTSEIDADLEQNDMLLYLIPSRQLNLSYANEYTCHRGDIVKWHTHYTCIKFPSAFS